MALYRFNVFVVVLYLAIFQDVGCDYSCICNYNVELAVFGSATETGNTIGYMYEFDCKPHVLVDKLNNKWLAVAFENQLGFIQKDAQILIQTCPGKQPDEDKLTTTPHTTILKPTGTMSTSTSFLSSAIFTRGTPKPVDSSASTLKGPTVLSLLQPKTQTISSSSSNTIRTHVTTRHYDKTPIELTVTTYNTSKSTSMKYSTSSKFITLPFTSRMTLSNNLTDNTAASAAVPITSMSPSMSPAASSKKTTLMSISTSKDSVSQTTTHVTFSPRFLLGDTSRCREAILPGHFISQYGQHCYELVTHYNRNWMLSELFCRSRGGHLLSVYSAAEEEYVYQLLTWRHVNEAIWTGLNDKDDEEIFRWSSGEPVLYRNGINWKKGRKSSSYEQEDCVLLQPGTYPGDWDDVNCNASHAFICKYDIGKDVSNVPVHIG